MNQSLKKEWFYALRNYRVLILMASFIFFAIMTPVLSRYILPEVLKGQFPGMDDQAIAGMLDLTQAGSLQSYLADMFEIGTLIVVFTLCGLLAQEIRERTLVMALCSGRRYAAIILSKFIVHSILLVTVTTTALMVSYVYSGIIFAFDVDLAAVLVSGLIQGAYMIFILSCLLCIGSLIAKPIATGLITLGLVYGSQVVAGLLGWQKWLPAGLSEAAIALEIPDVSFLLTLAIVVSLAALALIIAVQRLKTMELRDR